MDINKIIVLFSDGRSGSNAIFSWMEDNLEDSLGFDKAHGLIYNYPFDSEFKSKYNGESNLLFRSEFTSCRVKLDDIFKHIDSDGNRKNINDLCKEYHVFMNLRDFYNYISSWIALDRTKPTENLKHKARIWIDRAKLFLEKPEGFNFILYNRWDLCPFYRKEINDIFSSSPINDSNKSEYNCIRNNSKTSRGLPSNFETNNRHSRFNELDVHEHERFMTFLKEFPEACELSDEIFGKVYGS